MTTMMPQRRAAGPLVAQAAALLRAAGAVVAQAATRLQATGPLGPLGALTAAAMVGPPCGVFGAAANIAASTCS